MRRFLTLLVVCLVGIVFAIPPEVATAVTIEPENSFCIYGIPGMYIEIFAGSDIIRHTFGSSASHFNDPFIITNEMMTDWYNSGVSGLNGITIHANNACAATFTSPNSIISYISENGASGYSLSVGIASSDGGTFMSVILKLINYKRMYLFPTGTLPHTAGVEPTPFVNDGEDIVVDDTHIKSTIGAVNDFQPFIQFIFSTVIPWASVAGVVILVLATVKFMLKG